MTMIIDCHGHYTVLPKAHDAWREAQKAAFKTGEAAPPYPAISDDEIRETIEANQLRLIRERGADMTIFSPRASTMAPHVGDQSGARVVGLYPEVFAGVCMLPQSPEADMTNSIAELRRCVNEHAAQTIDLFAHQAGKIVSAHALQGPKHPELGIAMDMSIQLKSERGAICTLSLSFNNDGPLGTFFRYIGDTGTYLARYDDLFTGKEQPIDLTGVAVSNNGIELQDREFVAAIREGREPNSSLVQVLDCYRVIGELAQQLEA